MVTITSYIMYKAMMCEPLYILEVNKTVLLKTPVIILSANWLPKDIYQYIQTTP